MFFLISLIFSTLSIFVNSEPTIIGFKFGDDPSGLSRNQQSTYNEVKFKSGPDARNYSNQNLVDVSYCFRINLNYVNTQCALGSAKYFQFRINRYDSKFGFVYLKGVSFIYKIPKSVVLMPETWYHACFSYNATANHHISAVINGAVILNETASDVLGGNSSALATSSVILDNLRLGKCNSTAPKEMLPFQGTFTDVNIWSSPLSFLEMEAFTTGCNLDMMSHRPEVFQWEKQVELQTELGQNVERIYVGKGEICKDERKSFVRGLSPQLTFDNAKLLCTQLGGRLYYPKDEVAGAELMSLLRSEQFATVEIWLPIVQRNSENFSTQNDIKWVHSGSDEIETFLPWSRGQPNGKDQQKCVAFERTMKNFELMDKECWSTISSICYFDGPYTPFTVRGLCPKSSKDYKFSMKFNKSDEFQPLAFQGFTKERIVWNNKFERWELRSSTETGFEVLAFYNISSNSPIGKKSWYFLKDCDGNEDLVLKELKFSQCPEDSFTCDDGLCIDFRYRCNEFSDCHDFSDENNCTLLRINNMRYHKRYAPVSVVGEKLIVNVSLDILSILNINDIRMEFAAKFKLQLKWFDARLTFIDLKSVPEYSNLLSQDDLNRIWIPKLVFSNSDNNQAVNVDPSMSIAILQLGSSSTSPLSESTGALLYSGPENVLNLMKEYDLTFMCDFDLKMFPFDTQHCFIQISLPLGMEQFVRLSHDNISFSGTATLLQFKVENVSAGEVGENFLTINIYLQRMFYYHLVIAEITLYIDEEHFDTTVMVSLTSMLVMYTLYQSISGSLPQTAYLKMIDAWLLFGLLMPFVVFICEVIWKLMIQNSDEDGIFGSKKSSDGGKQDSKAINIRHVKHPSSLPSSGVNFNNILCADLMCTDQKGQSSPQCLFALLGNSQVKAACKTLVKSTPGVNQKKSDMEKYKRIIKKNTNIFIPIITCIFIIGYWVICAYYYYV